MLLEKAERWRDGRMMAIDFDTCVDLAIRRLRSHQAERRGAALYLLVDPTLRDPLADEPVLGVLKRYVLPIRHPDIEWDKRPYLCLIDDPVAQEKVINRSIAIAVREMQKTTAPFVRSVCAWLLDDIRSPFELGRCLARGAVKTDPRRQRRILRFWDPRVLPALVAHERGYRLLPQLSAVDWLALDSNAALQSVPYPAEVSTAPVSRLTPSDEALLANISLENAAACALLERDGAWPERGSLSPHIIRARELNLTDQDDIAAFVADRERQAVPIERADRVIAVLAAVRDDGASYEKLVAAWDDDDWKVITDEARQRAANDTASERTEGTQP